MTFPHIFNLDKHLYKNDHWDTMHQTLTCLISKGDYVFPDKDHETNKAHVLQLFMRIILLQRKKTSRL